MNFELSATAVVLTTGTFMRGLMHTGESKTPGGRFGEAPAVGISGALAALGFELGRLARERRPQLPVLYATGYSASYAAPEKGADMLAKPYREADLRSKLRGLLPIRARA